MRHGDRGADVGTLDSMTAKRFEPITELVDRAIWIEDGRIARDEREVCTNAVPVQT